MCSDLPVKNIQYYRKLQLPILHRQFFKILSQEPENVKTHRNVMEDPFHFACRKRLNQEN